MDLDALADATVTDLDGNPVRLGGLWQNRNAVLLFLRHFG